MLPILPQFPLRQGARGISVLWYWRAGSRSPCNSPPRTRLPEAARARESSARPSSPRSCSRGKCAPARTGH